MRFVNRFFSSLFIDFNKSTEVADKTPGEVLGNGVPPTSTLTVDVDGVSKSQGLGRHHLVGRRTSYSDFKFLPGKDSGGLLVSHEDPGRFLR